MPRAHKSKVSREMQNKIVKRYSELENATWTAKEFEISTQTVLNIVNRNLEEYGRYKEKLLESMKVNAGVVGNMALDALKNKSFGKEKSKSLAYIAETCSKITGNDVTNAIQVNTNIPVDREGILRYLGLTPKPDNQKDVVINDRDGAQETNAVEGEKPR